MKITIETNNKKVNVPTARETLVATTPNAMQYALDKINEAKQDGRTTTYINVNHSQPPMAVISTLLNKGYDIRYSAFTNDNNWFVKAEWHDCTSGKIFEEHLTSREVTLKQMFGLQPATPKTETEPKVKIQYILENITPGAYSRLYNSNIKFFDTETMNEVAFDTMEDYYDALRCIGREV